MSTDLRSAAARMVGESTVRRIGRIRRNTMRSFALHGSPAARRNTERLRSFAGRHTGETCVIMGNGPSLRSTPTDLLQRVPSFGLNRIFLGRDLLGFDPTYVVCVNRLVLEQSAAELEMVRSPLFVSYQNRDLLLPGSQSVLLYSNPTIPTEFGRDPSREGIWEGSTVTYVAMQLAFHMGFRRVVLVGVDHSFAAKGTPHQEVTSQSDDVDHFDPGYFGKGFRWQLPDLDDSEVSYSLARRTFEADGREIIDSTIGGQLRVFPKVDLAAAIGTGAT